MIRPKIFALAIQPPRMPGSGGEVRTYFFIRMLARLGDLTLVSLGGPGADRKVSDDIVAMCARVIEPGENCRELDRPAKPKSRLRSWMHSLGVLLMPWRGNWRRFYQYCTHHLQGESADTHNLSFGKRFLRVTLRAQFRIGARLGLIPPLSVFAYSDQFESLRQEVREALAKDKVDLAWYEQTVIYPFMADLMNSVTGPRPKLICNAHNIEWRLHERIGSTATHAWEAEFHTLQAQLLRTLERDQFNDCDLVFTCSEEDSALGRRMAPNTSFVTVGNGVDTEYFRRPRQLRRAPRPTLLFTGTFGYGPNRDGLRYFVEDIFPLIKQEMPEIEFVFAGYEAQRAYEEVGIDEDRVRCVSGPSDIRPCFHEAWVFVVPLRAGSGTRLKILEAMSMQCPVVSTTLGAEGIPGQDGVHFLLADSAEGFAEQTIRLLEDAALRRDIASESSVWVAQHYDWNKLCAQATRHLAALSILEGHE